MSASLTLDAFVISWSKQHDNAEFIARDLATVTQHCWVVWSDPDPEFDLALPPGVCSERRSNHLYFGDKFARSLELASSDLFFLVHADCHCQDWTELALKAKFMFSRFPRLGVWAPHVKKTAYDLETSSISRLTETSFVVANTDLVVVCFRKNLVERFRAADISGNIYGWYTDWLLMAAAYSSGQFAVVETLCTVRHPSGSGYSREEAAKYGAIFLHAFNNAERIQMTLLRNYIESRKKSPSA